MIENAIFAIVGERLDRITYLLPPSSESNERDHYGTFDEVDMGVELRTVSGRTFSCRWMMQNDFEGLVFGELSEAEGSSTYKRIDVSSASEWRPLVGRPITDVGVAWQPWGDPWDSVWSVRLVFDHAESVVLALGEVEDSQQPVIGFMPDTVVVIFEEETARAYRPRPGGASPWGELLTRSG